MDTVFFILCKIYIVFSFGFITALDSKTILHIFAKKGNTSAKE